MMTILEALNSITSHKDPKTASRDHCYSGLSTEEIAAYKEQGWDYYQGKVRELLKKDSKLLIVHSDRLSAFDTYIGEVPYKGQILAAITKFWFETLSSVFPHHYQGSESARVLRAKSCKPIKAEIVVRAYMAGSMLRAYEKGARTFCGVTLPEGLKPYSKLPSPIITPTSKAAAFEHDVEMTAEQLISSGVCSQDEWRQISDLALKLYEKGREVYAKSDWILVDTKYEFGKDQSGEIIIIDEVHTPDSSRLWNARNYEALTQQDKAPEMLDKEIVRRYLIEKGFKGQGKVPEIPEEVLVDLAKVYLQVAERLIGEPLLGE